MKTKIVRRIAIAYLAMLLTLFVMPVATYAADYNNMGQQAAGASEAATGAIVDEEASTEEADTIDTGSAITDIMDDSRFEGAVSSIAWLTKLTDKYFAMAITLVAFFIISAALLKNACAGAYCANSKFWDQVDAAHKKSEAYTIATAKQYVTGKGFMNTSPAGIKDFILGIVPNIKAFTDFDGTDIEPKQYFMKAIPQMIACVIIGVFIYNGYYRDTASVVGAFGAESFKRVIDAADPIGLADRLYNTVGTPEAASDLDKTKRGKLANAITHAAYTSIITKYTDITTASAKSALMAKIDEYAYECADTCAVYTGTEDGKAYTFNATCKLTASSLDKRKDIQKAKDQATFTDCMEDVKSQFAFDTEKSVDLPNLVTVVVFTRQTATGASSGDDDGSSTTSRKYEATIECPCSKTGNSTDGGDMNVADVLGSSWSAPGIAKTVKIKSSVAVGKTLSVKVYDPNHKSCTLIITVATSGDSSFHIKSGPTRKESN